MKASHTPRGHAPFKYISTLAVLAVVLLTVSHGHADGPRDLSWGRDADRSEWRLDGHNRIYLRTERGWQRVQGSATDLGDGWVIGTDRRNGGYGIYRWNGRRFDRMPGGAVQIGGSYERPWVVNSHGERFEWTGHDWREVGYGRPHRGERSDDRRGDRYDDRFGERRHERDRSRW